MAASERYNYHYMLWFGDIIDGLITGSFIPERGDYNNGEI